MRDRKQLYFRVELNGSYAIVPPQHLVDMLIVDDESTVFAVSAVYLTEEEYEAIPEFQGF
jgi:hypothetical protein